MPFGRERSSRPPRSRRTGDLFAEEEISARVPSAPELALARRVLSTDVVRSLGDIVFARVDVAPFRRADGTESHIVMELELIEPSFYFTTDPSTVEVFADRLIGWLRHRDLVADSRGER